MTGLLYRGVNRLATAPEEFRQELAKDFRAMAGQSLFQTGELLRLLEVLHAQGIHALPYKGPTLALMAYGDIAMRSFDDLDILVPIEQIPQGKDLLAGEGYRSDMRLSPGQERAYHRNDSEYQLLHEKHGVVELHWQVQPPWLGVPVDVQDWWGRAQEWTVAGRQVLVPALMDLLPALLGHASRHLWERMEWLCNIAHLIYRNPAINWKLLIEEAESAGVRRITDTGLLLAFELLDAPVPTDVLACARRDRVTCRLAAQVAISLSSTSPVSPSALRQALFDFQSRERFWHRVSYSFQRLFGPNSGEYRWLALPASLSLLYYPLRLLRFGFVLIRGRR